MRSKDKAKFELIANEMTRFWIAKGRMPSHKELSLSIGLCKSAIGRYIQEMRETGIIEGAGRELSTRETQLIPVPIVDSLQDSSHNYDNADIKDFVFVSRKLYGEGEIGAVRAIDDSMSGGNININSFIMIRRQCEAEIGQIVLVKSGGKYYLRRLIYDNNKNKRRLKSESNTYYEEITEYEIRGVAISIVTHLDDDIVARYLHQVKLRSP